MSDLSEGIILGIGNPLLDITCNVSDEFLIKWKLNANDAIMTEGESHDKLFTEITANYQCQYIAGGSCQNTLRTIQWMLSKPNLVTCFGGVGDDEFGRIMADKSREVGLNSVYMVDKLVPTGKCACLISQGNACRSLVAYLGASQTFNIQHVLDNYGYVEKAKIIYSTGYHLAVSKESILNLANHAHSNAGKLFAFNLSAPYISQVFGKDLLEVVPYMDILFGNETEAAAFAELNGWQTIDLKQVAKLAADMPCRRPDGRIVVITQGTDAVLVATTAHHEVREYPVPVVPESEIVDTIGAGDAFVGGYFAQLVRYRPIDACVRSGVYAAQQVIRQIGAHFPQQMTFDE
ncbi:unnamed protein product [Medioppia subpectinata]|uniref:Adenosine kinase n=1 Tax=Medioppia subpectinata TaxID=1979941 RepID=A0A7R9Q370_9ACAR|nr:unnamed protein product [Medioppia subpectinata]CAG2111006.1 unnamed protein product [Medioppia subpectinata]